MTTTVDLLELIRNGENSGVEFKEDTLGPRDLAKAIVCLANFQGGRILLGVDDSGSVVGVTRANLEEWVMSVCRDKIRPELIPYFEVLRDVEPGRDVAILTIEPGWNVHHVWHENHRTYYIRVGTECREASWEELARLGQQRGDFRVELRPVSGASREDLDSRRLRDYFQRVREQDVPRDDGAEAWERLLTNTEILSEDAVPTVAGLLLFGVNVNRFLPHAGIDCAAFPGEAKDYAAREHSALRGPMTPLYGSGGLVENGLVEQAVDFVRRNTAVSAYLENGARRVERWTYPEEAVREAIVNALIHRDYLLSSTDIELAIYSDRLEVISPGRLPNRVTPERMRAGIRAARNPLLKDVMRDYGYLEHMGLGVPRKIVQGMREHNETDPDLVEQDEGFLVRLWSDS